MARSVPQCCAGIGSCFYTGEPSANQRRDLSENGWGKKENEAAAALFGKGDGEKKMEGEERRGADAPANRVSAML